LGKALLDVSRRDDAHTGQRLSDELVIWFGSTRPDGRPHQVPLWFWWRDPELVIFSMPGTQKLRNISQAPSVALHLDTAAGGGDVVLAEGTATIVQEDAVAHLTGGFTAKYSPLLGAPGMSAWRATFAQPVLVAITRVVAWARSNGELAYRSVP
jgi:PPOX class probable F420-dependent enzyme